METGEIAEGETLEDAVLRLTAPLEALLFVAGEPLSIKQLAKLVRSSEVEVAASLQRIETDY
ncbi:MAG: SMC-Scp complex subunit ScpB, partial [Candidatus Eremiobacteraeota bacterium]|nr:SMC-Scp complex subunit ScpB [Candidatus Eremiobacteraeota bacterium]